MHTVIDKITVNLNMKKDTYEAEFSNLGIKNIPISEDYPAKFDRLLCGGIWCIVQLEYEFLALPTLIALCSIALGKPTLSSLAVLGEISIAGTMLKVDELANALQVCLDSGAKKVLLPITSAADLGLVPADLIGCFNLVFYQSAEDAVYKALGVE